MSTITLTVTDNVDDGEITVTRDVRDGVGTWEGRRVGQESIVKGLALSVAELIRARGDSPEAFCEYLAEELGRARTI